MFLVTCGKSTGRYAPAGLFLVLAIAFAFCLGSVALPDGTARAWADESDEPAVEAPSGLVNEHGGYFFYRKDGSLLKSSWKTVKGKRYYFGSSGKAVCGRAAKIAGKYWVFGNKAALLTGKKRTAVKLTGGTYAVNAKGHPLYTGFRLSSTTLRHYSKAGKLSQGKTVDGVTFLKSGVAKSNTASKLKVAVMQRLAQTVKPSWSISKKLDACWHWVVSRHFVISMGGTYPASDIGRQGWVQRCAWRVFRTGDSCCFGYACTFAMFAHELGLKPTVWASTAHGHGYTVVNGKRYDNMAAHPYVGGKHPYKVLSYSKISGVIKGTSATKAKSTKLQGLVTKKGVTRFYQDGKAVKKTWKTVGGKTYYFGADGKAVTGPHKLLKGSATKKAWYVFGSKGVLSTGTGIHTVKVGKATYRVTAKGKAKPGWVKDAAGNPVSLYLANGKLACGPTCYKGKLYVFSKKGIYKAAKTEKARAAAVANELCAELLELLGEPDAVYELGLCEPVPGMEGGKNRSREWENLVLTTYVDTEGLEYYLSHAAR